ncbi:MAG: allantoicase [Deltaproteobacteria bacterium]|nr:allantoicase [Deltaproteobacteria bacterium]MBK8238682.1 allantoicase [Deltaproteobacteria bacterium]MBK8715562.1 allantoicase [Deltaproteobacteria bacterium]MBP7287164.1 allantoicase [Nannocystaceae bacterium]
MTAKDLHAATFTGLVNLADEFLGAQALLANDEFFAPKENLLKSGRGVFLPDEYTDRGKLMDGWESRRRRGPGHDWCIIKLGTPGRVRVLDIDTNHFLGNSPPYASVDAIAAAPDADPDVLAREGKWYELLPQSPIRPGSQNIFPISHGESWPRSWTHLRLNIYPDGGVARFRAHGDIEPNWNMSDVDTEVAPRLQPGEVDLAAVRHGGLALACSDMFFGPMNNLLLPGRSQNMGGGWETRRRRGPGFDWIIVRLGAPGEIGLLEVDTNFFKGNFPDCCSLEGIDAPRAPLTELVDASAAWRGVLPETKLQPHTRHFFRDEIVQRGPFTHVRLSIYPDGGISRLRVFGNRVQGSTP